MKRIVLIIISLLIVVSNIFSQTYLSKPDNDKDSRMQWWRDARFGMFIHWGLYAIPAGEWNGETKHAEWIRTTAQIPLETYDKFLSKFNPTEFNADEWVLTAKNAGMKYIVITSKHHDGFCLFDSKFTDFDVMSTPFKRDILKELSDAAKKHGIKLGFYYSIMDWHHPDYLPRREWEKNRSSENADFNRYITYMKNQLKELLTNYEISILWFDGEWEDTWNHNYAVELYHYIKKINPDILINNRIDVGRTGMAGMTKEGYLGDFGTPEQEIPTEGFPGVDWESCITMNNHWGYNKNDKNWKSAKDVIKMLVNIISKGGNLLLNVGPKSNGKFPQESIDILNEVGKWLDKNKEAVFDKEPSPFKELKFGNCTKKSLGDITKLYFTIFDWPANSKLIIPDILNKPKKAYLLSDKNKTPLRTTQLETSIEISLNGIQPDLLNNIIVLEIYGIPDITNPPVILSKTNIFIKTNEIKLSTDRENVEIRYTLDGTLPTADSKKYTTPFLINKTTTVSAACFRNGKSVSGSVSKRYKKVLPEPSLCLENIKNGLVVNYYEGKWDMLPKFENLVPVKTSIANNIDVSAKQQDNYYGLMFTGFIKLPEDDIYTFFTESDDGSQLFIDNILIVDNDGQHGMETRSGQIALKKGYHKIKVTFFEMKGGDDLKVSFKTLNSEKRTLPSTVLFYEHN